MCFLCLFVANPLPLIEGLYGKIVFSPPIQSALERKGPAQSEAPQLKCYSSACRFIRAGAIENNLLIRREIFRLKFDMVGQHVKSSRNAYPVRIAIQTVAHIEDDDILPSVHLCFEFFRCDAQYRKRL